MTNDKKERVVVWLRHSQVEHMNSWLEADHCENQTEMVEKALTFYLGYLTAKDASELINGKIVEAINNVIHPYVKRISALLFNFSVELNTALHVIARHYRADESNRRALRETARQEVAEAMEKISFKNALSFQRQ